MNDDKADALADAKKFLDLYYSADYSKERLPAHLRLAAGLHHASPAVQGVRLPTHHLRISTMRDPMEQFRRVVEDVLPYVN